MAPGVRSARRSDIPTQFAGTSLAPPWAVGSDGQPLQTGGDIRQSWLCHKTTDIGTAGPQGRDVIGILGPAPVTPTSAARRASIPRSTSAERKTAPAWACLTLHPGSIFPSADAGVGRAHHNRVDCRATLIGPPSRRQLRPDGGPIGTVRDCLSPNPALYRTPLKMAHSRLTRSQRRRSSERTHRRRGLPVKRDNGNRVRYKRPGLVPLRGKGHQCPCTTP